jgi:hypothetical protein
MDLGGVAASRLNKTPQTRGFVCMKASVLSFLWHLLASHLSPPSLAFFPSIVLLSGYSTFHFSLPIINSTITVELSRTCPRRKHFINDCFIDTIKSYRPFTQPFNR